MTDIVRTTRASKKKKTIYTHAIWKQSHCEMKQSPVDIFCLDRDGWCLAWRFGFGFSSLRRLFCLASPESCYVFGQLPSYLLLHSNCHWTLLIPRPCLACHVPSSSGNNLFSIPSCPSPFTCSPSAIFPPFSGSMPSYVYSPSTSFKLNSKNVSSFTSVLRCIEKEITLFY